MKTTISYFGLPGSYSHEMALRRFVSKRKAHPLQSCRTVEEVFGTLRRGESSQGVVPIENTLGGPIPDTVDQLTREDFPTSGLRICEALTLRVNLALLGHRGQVPQKIYSHFAPLKNCGGWLRQKYADAELIEVESTAEAASRASKDKKSAAVASAGAASIYRLNVLHAPLPSEAENITQFFVIGTHPPPLRSNSHTAVVFGLQHKPGSLVNALGVLAKHRLNLTRIVSRAKPLEPSEYLFLIEFEGHLGQPKVRAAYDQLLRCTQFVRPLGSFLVRKEFA
jgi:chorismate mutase/prephenate dehydratase